MRRILKLAIPAILCSAIIVPFGAYYLLVYEPEQTFQSISSYLGIVSVEEINDYFNLEICIRNYGKSQIPIDVYYTCYIKDSDLLRSMQRGTDTIFTKSSRVHVIATPDCDEIIEVSCSDVQFPDICQETISQLSRLTDLCKESISLLEMELEVLAHVQELNRIPNQLAVEVLCGIVNESVESTEMKKNLNETLMQSLTENSADILVSDLANFGKSLLGRSKAKIDEILEPFLEEKKIYVNVRVEITATGILKSYYGLLKAIPILGEAIRSTKTFLLHYPK